MIGCLGFDIKYSRKVSWEFRCHRLAKCYWNDSKWIMGIWRSITLRSVFLCIFEIFHNKNRKKKKGKEKKDKVINSYSDCGQFQITIWKNFLWGGRASFQTDIYRSPLSLKWLYTCIYNFKKLSILVQIWVFIQDLEHKVLMLNC